MTDLPLPVSVGDGTYYAINDFVGDGTTIQWEPRFVDGYLAKEYIYVDDWEGNSLPFAWGTGETIIINPPVEAGKRFRIYRDTPKGEPLVEFQDGAVVTQRQLNKVNRQHQHALVEVYDRFSLTDAHTQEVLDVATGIDAKATDALAKASEANATANSALVVANGIEALASTALENSEAALATAGNALTVANGIDGKATSALAKAHEAKTDSALALSTAQGIDAKATEALQKSSEALGLAQNVLGKRDTVADLAVGTSSDTGQVVYVKEYRAGYGDGGGFFRYNHSKSSLNDGGLVINGWERVLEDGYVTPEHFGAVKDGVADDRVILQKVMDSDVSNVRLSGDYFLQDDGITVTKNKKIVTDGARLIATASYFRTPTSERPATPMLHVKGVGIVGSEKLPQSISNGGYQAKVSNSSLYPLGSKVVLLDKTDSSFSYARSYYNKGEFAIVAERPDSTTIGFSSHLYDSYSVTANTYLYRMSLVSVDITGLEFVAVGGLVHQALVYSYAENSIIERCKLHNVAGQYHICVRYSYGVEINSCYSELDQIEVPMSNNPYTCIVTNSQRVQVNGGVYRSWGHAIATGGDDVLPIVVREFIGQGLTAETRGQTMCLDMHGNVEYSGYYNCTVRGGITMGAGHNTFSGNTVHCGQFRHTDGVDYASLAFYTSEPSTFNFTLSNNTVIKDGWYFEGYGEFAHFALTDKIHNRGDVFIKLSGNVFRSSAPNTFSSISKAFVLITGTATSATSNTLINLDMSNESYYLPSNTNAGKAVGVVVSLVAGNLTANVSMSNSNLVGAGSMLLTNVNNVHALNNSYDGCERITATGTGNFVVRNNTFTLLRRALDTTMTGYTDISNNYVTLGNMPSDVPATEPHSSLACIGSPAGTRHISIKNNDVICKDNTPVYLVYVGEAQTKLSVEGNTLEGSLLKYLIYTQSPLITTQYDRQFQVTISKSSPTVNKPLVTYTRGTDITDYIATIEVNRLSGFRGVIELYIKSTPPAATYTYRVVGGADLIKSGDLIVSNVGGNITVSQLGYAVNAVFNYKFTNASVTTGRGMYPVYLI